MLANASSKLVPARTCCSVPTGAAPAVIEHRNVIAQLLDQDHHMAAHHDRASGGEEAVQDGAYHRSRDRIDRLERLIKHQHLRTMQQRRGQPDLLAHARRVVADQRAVRMIEIERGEQLVDPRGHHRRAASTAAGRGR